MAVPPKQDAVYLDYAATTPCDPAVVEEMLPFFSERFGNPANPVHQRGQDALNAVEIARERAANLIGALPQEIIWTSGATESNNFALDGVFAGQRVKRPIHIITTAIEHKAVLEPVHALETFGCSLTVVPPDANGVVTPDAIAAALREDSLLVSVMWANNEIGTINDIPAIGELCRSRGVLLHSDATQWVGKMPTRKVAQAVDLLSWSSHKIYGPKGVGALFVRRSLPFGLMPLIRGGGQERGLRSGTLNVAGIVGFGKACSIAARSMTADAERLRSFRDRMEATLMAELPGTVVNGRSAPRLPHISSMTFVLPQLRGNLMEILPGIECSSGAACGTRDLAPSHVLQALSVPSKLARSTLRLSLGRPTTSEDVGRAVAEIVRVAKPLLT